MACLRCAPPRCYSEGYDSGTHCCIPLHDSCEKGPGMLRLNDVLIAEGSILNGC